MFSLRAGLALLAFVLLPLFEIILIRGSWHQAFGANTIVLGIHATDVYIPLLLGTLYAFWRLRDHVGRFPFSFQPWGLAANLGLLNLLVFYLGQYNRLEMAGASPPWLISGTLCLSALSVITSFFIFFSPRTVWNFLAPFRQQSLYFLLGVLCLVGYQNVLDGFWEPSARFTAEASRCLLRLVGIPVQGLLFI